MSLFPCTLWSSSHERKSHTLCAAHDEQDTKETDKGIKKNSLYNMRGVMRHYYNRGIRRGEITPSLIDVLARRTYLNHPGASSLCPSGDQGSSYL